MTTTDKMVAASGANNMSCAFCKKNGEVPQFYTSHKLKDENNCVQCPVLKQYTCPNCNLTGMHTASYCPKNSSNNNSSSQRAAKSTWTSGASVGKTCASNCSGRKSTQPARRPKQQLLLQQQLLMQQYASLQRPQQTRNQQQNQIRPPTPQLLQRDQREAVAAAHSPASSLSLTPSSSSSMSSSWVNQSLTFEESSQAKFEQAIFKSFSDAIAISNRLKGDQSLLIDINNNNNNIGIDGFNRKDSTVRSLPPVSREGGQLTSKMFEIMICMANELPVDRRVDMFIQSDYNPTRCDLARQAAYIAEISILKEICF